MTKNKAAELAEIKKKKKKIGEDNGKGKKKYCIESSTLLNVSFSFPFFVWGRDYAPGQSGRSSIGRREGLESGGGGKLGCNVNPGRGEVTAKVRGRRIVALAGASVY